MHVKADNFAELVGPFTRHAVPLRRLCHRRSLDFHCLLSDISYEHTFITIMARPHKQRFVGPPPRATVFKPQGMPVHQLEMVILSLDELEALRLADLEGDQQEQAAAKMNISRPTFGRILDSAHKTVADSLLNGKALCIKGGPVTAARREEIRCHRCRRAWEVPLPAAAEFQCPHCLEKAEVRQPDPNGHHKHHT